MSLIYRNFDLFLEKNEDGYWARVLESPVGQAVSSFTLPFSLRELEQFILLIGEPIQLDAQRLEMKRSAVLTMGGRLFQALFRERLLAALLSSIKMVAQEGAHLRIRLRTSNAPELTRLPWEYLYGGNELGFLALSTQTPLVRYTDLLYQAQKLSVEPPLRALVVIAAPAGLPPVNVEREWLHLIDSVDRLGATRKILYERLARPTLLELQRRLRQGQYNIFHFIGHGDFDTQAQDGMLIFEDEFARPRSVSGQHLGGLLKDHFPLRLAVINACKGAHANVQNPFMGVAQSAVQRGLPAVLAMQYATSDHASAIFNRSFYSAIADDEPLDAALVTARKAIFAEQGGIEWGTPVLFMRTPDGLLFEKKALSDSGKDAATGKTYNDGTRRVGRGVISKSGVA